LPSIAPNDVRYNVVGLLTACGNISLPYTDRTGAPFSQNMQNIDRVVGCFPTVLSTNILHSCRPFKLVYS